MRDRIAWIDEAPPSVSVPVPGYCPQKQESCVPHTRAEPPFPGDRTSPPEYRRVAPVERDADNPRAGPRQDRIRVRIPTPLPPPVATAPAPAARPAPQRAPDYVPLPIYTEGSGPVQASHITDEVFTSRIADLQADVEVVNRACAEARQAAEIAQITAQAAQIEAEEAQEEARIAQFAAAQAFTRLSLLEDTLHRRRWWQVWNWAS